MSEEITVIVEDAHQDRIEEVADLLRASGMQVQQVLPTIGVITGTVSSSERSTISNVFGVANVESQETYRLPPPEADIQ